MYHMRGHKQSSTLKHDIMPTTPSSPWERITLIRVLIPTPFERVSALRSEFALRWTTVVLKSSAVVRWC